MQNWNWFLLIALVLPLIAAILSYVIPASPVRKTSVILTVVLLIGAALWLHTRVSFEPVALSFKWADRLVFIADLAILLYIGYVAVKARHYYLIALAFLQLIGLAYLELILRPDTAGIPSLVIDRLSVVMYLVISVVGSIICVYALKYMDEHEEHVHSGRNGRFFLWFILFLGVMNGLVFSNNLFWLYLFWEGTTLCSFQLIGHDDTDEARRNALRALFYNSIGGLAMLVGILIMVKVYGSSTASLMALVNSGPGVPTTTFLIFLALFSLAGFTKAAQFPFQSWLLGAMVAPTPVSALLHSSTMVKAGVYLIIRLGPAYAGTLLSTIIALLGVFTFFSASLLAVGEDNAKRVLAYSTVANLGLIIACAGLNTPLAIAAAVLLIMFHAVSKALLFMAVGVVEHRLGSRNIENMESLAVKMPAMTLVMTIGVFSMFLPPFGMLFSKWAAMESAIRSPLLLVFFIVGSTLTALFWIKWLGRMLATSPRAETVVKPFPMSGYYVTTLGSLALGAVLLSLGISIVVSNLALPAIVTWYPPSIQVYQGLNLAVFSWADYFGNQNMVNPYLPQGLFPLGVLAGAFILTLVIPRLLVRSEEEVSNVYLCGENVDEDVSQTFVTAMEGTSQVELGGYYFRRILGDKLGIVLNIIALVILLLMMGVAII